MKVSIVMVAAGNEKQLQRVISSILQQTYKKIEVIIISIGTGSKNIGLLKDISNTDSRVKIYETDQGWLESINQGFSAASGDYFMKMSNNMILMTDTIERIMHIFQRRKNTDFIYADAFFQDQRGCDHEEMLYLNNEIENFYLYHPARVCFVYKRKVHEILKGYQENGIYDINNDFWIRANEARFSMYHVKGRMYYYILNQKILSINDRNKLMDERIRICKRAAVLCDISIKRKMYEAIIAQCRKYGRYKEGIFLILYLRDVKNLFFMSKLRKDKILKDSKTSFDIMADTYEQGWCLEEVRKCYDPVLSIVKNYASSDIKLLDVGCGTGVMLKRISNEFPNAEAVHGIDLSPMMVEKTNAKLQSENAYAVEGTLDSLDLSKDFYNIVLCMHSFHHYPEPLESLRQMYRVLRKGGILVIADDCYRGWKRIRRNVDLYKKNYPLGDMWMYSFRELIVLTRLAGFKQQEYQEIGKSFIYICKKI